MALASSRSLRRLLALALLGSGTLAAAIAQPGSGGVCDEALAAANAHYLNQDYDEVEPFVLTCVYRSEATPAERQRAYRLLTLTFIKQDLLTEAQLTIVKILGVDYGYEADPVADPPFYIALVDAVKEQLRIDGRRPDASAPPPNSGPDDSDEAAPILVNVNTATAEELDAVPGIGPAIAGRIVEYREQNGLYRSLDDLQGVRGIGPRNIQGMLPHLTVSGTTTVTRAGGGVPATTPVEPPHIESATVRPLINLNTATAEELQTLDGIGATYAARIIEYREEYGPFQRVEEVTLVRGIGARTLAGFIDRVTVE